MASFVSSSFLLIFVLLLIFLEFGQPRPQHFIGVGNKFFMVKNPSQTEQNAPIMLAKASTNPLSSGQVYILRRKTSNQSNQNHQQQQQKPINYNYDAQETGPKSSFSIPIVSPGLNQMQSNKMDQIVNLDSKLKSLEQEINNAYISERYFSRPGTLYRADATTETTGTIQNAHDFRSNIQLPQNPFMFTQMAERSDSDTPMENFDLPVAAEEEGLQNMLNKYLEDMYRSKSPISNQNPSMTFDTSRSDSDFTSTYGQQNAPKSYQGSSHYSKISPKSSNIESEIPYFQEAQSRVSYTSVLEKLSHAHQFQEVFPPTGSYTPYGERTILMVKYPGMPENKANNNNNLDKYYNRYGNKKPFSFKSIWNPFKTAEKEFPLSLEPKASDFGVIVSQNFILQPTDGFGPSRFETDETSGDNSNPGNLVSQLAKALAERNRIINAYSSSPISEGKDVTKKPPFVLVHLESFTKKSNKSGRFGFDDGEVNKNYSNGTIIYPTKNNPNILASTKFEFENINDVVFLFDRPLEGLQNGRMKPIVPVGIDEIKMFLKLVYEVHRDVHNGVRKKVADLKELSSSLNKQSMNKFGSLNQNVDYSQRKFNDNWLHTSSIGLRSLG